MPVRGPKKLEFEKLLDYGLQQLGARAHSTGELRVKLQRRAAHTGDADEVLRRLKEAGYLDDRSFADSYAAVRLQSAGLGRQRVLRDLRERRVAPAVAEAAVNRTFAETDEIALIQAYLERKYRGKALAAYLAEEKNLAAAYRRLRYAGFSAGNSLRVLKQYAERAEELEGAEDASG